jgi:DNA-binding transcriptional MerR regulator
MTTGAAQERLYRIGEVAEQVGVTTRTIRYYEELGLLGAEGSRPKGGHRLYTESDVARLRELVRLRDLLGLSLDELAKLAEAEQARNCLRVRWQSTTDDAERARILRASIPLVERQLELVHARQQNLNEFERELSEKLELMRHRMSELDPDRDRAVR